MTPSPNTSHDHTTTTSQAAVVFIDLSGFTALTEAHGDQQAAALAEAFADLTRATLGDRDRLIKTLGDAILVTSPTARTAIALLGRITTTTLTHHGTIYRFCSTSCARRFAARPNKFTTTAGQCAPRTGQPIPQ